MRSEIPQGDPSRTNCNVIHVEAAEPASYGFRTPQISLRKSDKRLIISSAISNDHNHQIYYSEMKINQTIWLQIQQRYTSNGKYRFKVNVNGIKIGSVINNNAQQFYGASVWMSGPIYEACPVSISNFKMTNFPWNFLHISFSWLITLKFWFYKMASRCCKLCLKKLAVRTFFVNCSWR